MVGEAQGGMHFDPKNNLSQKEGCPLFIRTTALFL